MTSEIKLWALFGRTSEISEVLEILIDLDQFLIGQTKKLKDLFNFVIRAPQTQLTVTWAKYRRTNKLTKGVFKD